MYSQMAEGETIFPFAPGDAGARPAILRAYNAGPLADDEELTALAKFAGDLCNVPIALVNLVQTDTQLYLATHGVPSGTAELTDSFCEAAMGCDGPMEVLNASQDDRFRDYATVTGEPHVRYYYGVPLVSPEGVPLGSLCVIDQQPRTVPLGKLERQGMAVLAQAAMRRLNARRRALEAQADRELSESSLYTLADSIPDIAWTNDHTGKMEYFNRRWSEFTGLSLDSLTTETLSAAFHPDDKAGWLDGWNTAIASGDDYTAEYRLRRTDGEYRWFLARALPVRREDGSILRWFGTLTDIDDTHRKSESRDLLARELSHRIKNIFAVVSSLVSLRARGKPEVKEFAEELTETVRALGRAHDYVRPLEGRKGDSLRGLLDDLLSPYRNGMDERIAVTGDDRSIGARAATPLALVFHELATNSAKYGALSTDHGSVSIAIQPDVDEDNLQIIWRETAGEKPPEDGPAGFGSRLVKTAVEGQLGGSLERHFGDDGMRVELTVSMASIAS